jgi:transglutaminase-like putative cysteine protease
MRIRVDHRTSYRYDRPASGVVQMLRLRPRDHDGQHVVHWRIDADVDGSFRQSVDPFGNCVTAFYAAAPVDAVCIRVTGEVDVTDTAGLVRAPEPLPSAVFLRPTPLTEITPAVAAFADRFAGPPPLAALHALMTAIHGDMRFEVGATGVATTAEAALAAGHGVCQDFAHVFVAAARRLGCPARYVSGHLARSGEQEAAHAWAEALVPGLGWVAFDPANGICATECYVRVAVGRDYLDAAPVRGARRGGGEERMDVQVMATGEQVQSQAGQWQSQRQG